MNKPGTLANCDEALEAIERIEDMVTRTLVEMAFVHLTKQVHLKKDDLPTSDFDMLFLVRSLTEFFAERDVLKRTLEGEKVGAWFE